MLNPAKKATCRTFLCALAFASLASGQVVERGRTLADLIQSHPCDTGLTNRIARVTDCDAADDIGDGGGAFQCWAYCDGSAPWTNLSIGGGGGGGEATSVQGSGTLPATCTEKDLYQDTDSGGTEFYVCTATNTWTKMIAATDNVATATALAANGSNCSAGNYPLGVDASGAAESCTAAATGTIGGTLGTTAEAPTCASGTGGATAKACVQAAFPIGTAAAPPIVFGSTTSAGLYADSGMTNGFAWSANGTASGWFRQAQIGLVGNGFFAWGASTNNLGSGANDLTLFRTAAGVLKLGGSDASGDGWINSAGRVALAADFTNATATMSNMTGLSVTLKTGRKYTFDAAFFFTDSVAAEGAKFDFDGGAATATSFVANCQMFDAALLLSSETTAIATDFAAATTTNASALKCSGSFVVNAAGTLIPRAAQNSHSTGTLTVKTGSFFNVRDTSFN